MNVVKMETIENCIIAIRCEKLLIDRDVAEIYGVDTKRVNEAVKNNRNKFPEDYLFEISQDEKDELVENFDRFNRLKHSTAKPKAFTEKGYGNNICYNRNFCTNPPTVPKPQSTY